MVNFKEAACFVLGVLLVTGLFYGAVTASSVLFRDPQDSYFDRAPYVADVLMFAWIVCMARWWRCGRMARATQISLRH